jgi:cytochrome c
MRQTGAIRHLIAAGVVVASGLGCERNGENGHADAPVAYAPPSDSVIPATPLGESIRRGRAILIRTTDSLPAYAPGAMQCASCHLDAGRHRDAAALIGVYSRFPTLAPRASSRLRDSGVPTRFVQRFWRDCCLA